MITNSYYDHNRSDPDLRESSSKTILELSKAWIDGTGLNQKGTKKFLYQTRTYIFSYVSIWYVWIISSLCFKWQES